MTTSRKLLVTCALPYANGSLHLGHILEYIQADIWIRFQRMQELNCLFICGDDTHGTPVMLSAKQQGITPEALINQIQQEHARDIADFLIDFDNFYTTHSSENRELSELIYERMLAKGDIVKRTISQAYDPKEQMFLPDRYVKGACPCCKTPDQYGDNCEACGSTYTPLDLKDPISVISGTTPIAKESEHYFLKLANYTEFLRNWITAGHVQTEVSNKLLEWFKEGLHDLDISRDAPYFGFTIPDTQDKYFYVWLDAPIGYMAILKNLCKRQKDLNFDEYWDPDSKAELYHFIGKDIINFHAIFWPAILQSANFRTPTEIFVHGYLTIDNQKMSKSRGTFIKARTYLEHLNPEYLRYYFAAKLNDRIEDIDLNFNDFVQRINADLVGKVVNIASRSANFIHKYFMGKLAAEIDTSLITEFTAAGNAIAENFVNREFSRAVRNIMELADRANQYIDAEKPWALVKQEDKLSHVHQVCSISLNLFRLLTIYLKPILPHTAKQVEQFLNIPELTWKDNQTILQDHKINPFTPLLQRITLEQIDAMKMATQNEQAMTETVTSKLSYLAQNPLAPQISFEDFAKVDLRIAKIIHAENILEADKLLKLTVDLGNETRQIFAGIKSAFQPEDLIGKLTVIVANLAPRQMRFGTSEGMLILAGGDNNLFLLSPSDGAQPGMKVK